MVYSLVRTLVQQPINRAEMQGGHVETVVNMDNVPLFVDEAVTLLWPVFVSQVAVATESAA
jgi:hypothetical protein